MSMTWNETSYYQVGYRDIFHATFQATCINELIDLVSSSNVKEGLPHTNK